MPGEALATLNSGDRTEKKFGSNTDISASSFEHFQIIVQDMSFWLW
jgi:hypothetical protein